MKIKISFLAIILVVISGCSSFKPEVVLEKYLTAKSPSQRFRWITSESQKRFGKESFVKSYKEYLPAEEILELRRFPIDNEKYIRLRARTKDSKCAKTFFYTLKRDRFHFYRVCWNNILFEEANSHINNKLWEEARAVAKEALQFNPYDEHTVVLMAIININTDRREEAWKNIQNAMELNPNDPKAFLTASRYWEDQNPEKSKRYAQEANKIAAENFDNAPASDYYVRGLLATITDRNLQSLLQRRNLLRHNLVHYSSSTAALACTVVLSVLYVSVLYENSELLGNTELQKDLDDWLKVATENYGDDIHVRDTISLIQTKKKAKAKLYRYLKSPKGRLETKLYKILGSSYVYSLQYALANVKDQIKMVAMKGSNGGGWGVDFSLIRKYDELDWLGQFEKIRKLINNTVSSYGTAINPWYAKKRLWADWLYINEDMASKIASNF